MKLFDFFKSGKPISSSEKILGRWKIFKSEGEVSYEKSSVMEFLKDGKLIYSFQQENKTVIMNLVYKLDGNVIISDQPSSPREERTEFCFETDDILFLRFNDNQSWFRRE